MRFILVVACINSSLFFIAEQHPIICRRFHTFSNHFPFLAIINNSTINSNIDLKVLFENVFSFKQVSRSRIAEWHGKFNLNFLRNYQTFLKWLKHFISVEFYLKNKQTTATATYPLYSKTLMERQRIFIFLFLSFLFLFFL